MPRSIEKLARSGQPDRVKIIPDEQFIETSGTWPCLISLQDSVLHRHGPTYLISTATQLFKMVELCGSSDLRHMARSQCEN